MWINAENGADLTFPLGDEQSKCVKSLVVSIKPLTFNYCDGMFTVMLSAESSPTGFSMKCSVVEGAGRKVREDEFEMIS